MANGHSIVPTNDKNLNHSDILELMEEQIIVFPDNLPHGQFPTLAELRGIIHTLGFELEESYDWYVTSKDDFTEIWFKTEDRQENRPIEFWCRRGHIIVLDIVQAIANKHGSFLVIDQSGLTTIVLVPISVLSSNPPPSGQHGFIAEMTYRIPIMIALLEQATPDTARFLLSQIYQVLTTLQYALQCELFPLARQGIAIYTNLIDNPDPRVRKIATKLVDLLQKIH
jgi:hypothetical protein